MLLRTAVGLTLGTLVGCTPDPGVDDPAPDGGSDPSHGTPTVPDDPDPTVTPDPEDPVPTILDDTFRIDLSEVDVDFDWIPEVALEGHAELTFTMRTAQTRALFHFDPLDLDALGTIKSLILDGEALDPTDESDVLEVAFETSREEAYELQRELSADDEHELIVDWSIPGGTRAAYPGWFQTTVDDTAGLGNESLWPTINSPEELARHTVEVRIDDPREYVMIGSGSVTSKPVGDLQVWTLDTGREISSYTVMFAAVPRDEVIVRNFDAGAVPVTIVSTEGANRTDQAEDLTRRQLGRLEADFGPFPMPSMQILLIAWPDGMEYYGATTTGLSSLSHELVHMYWGCSAVNRTWRDTWMDEAVNVWWENQAEFPPLDPDFHSGIVGARSEIQTGFDLDAYYPGSNVIDAIGEALGGDDAMVAFLADVYRRRAFAPYTTDEFLDDVIAETGDEALREDFERWLYTP